MPEFLLRVEQLCELEPATLDGSTVIEQIPGWSSLQFLGLISVVDELYGVTLKPRQLLDCSTLSELYAFAMQLRANK